MEKIVKGTRVVVVEGPHSGKSGKVMEVYRVYDKDAKATIRRVTIQLTDEQVFIQTRLSWVRRDG